MCKHFSNIFKEGIENLYLMLGTSSMKYAKMRFQYRDVLFEYHRAAVPFCWAVGPVRSLLKGITGLTAQQKGTAARWYSNKTSL